MYTTCTHCEAENSASSKFCSSCGYSLPKVVTTETEHLVPKKATKKTANKSLLGVAVGALAFFLSFYAVQQFFSGNSYDEAMMKVASEINKSCPFMVDADTRLDNVGALPGNVLQYNYTLINMDLVNTDTEGLKRYLEPVITNQVKTNPDMKVQRENKTTLNYSYKDRNGNFLFLISITPKKYS